MLELLCTFILTFTKKESLKLIEKAGDGENIDSLRENNW